MFKIESEKYENNFDGKIKDFINFLFFKAKKGWKQRANQPNIYKQKEIDTKERGLGQNSQTKKNI